MKKFWFVRSASVSVVTLSSSLRFEQKGFKLVAIRMMRPGEAHLREHYADLSHRYSHLFYHRVFMFLEAPVFVFPSEAE
jgi:nucleoside diphosphate kinase